MRRNAVADVVKKILDLLTHFSRRHEGQADEPVHSPKLLSFERTADWSFRYGPVQISSLIISYFGTEQEKAPDSPTSSIIFAYIQSLYSEDIWMKEGTWGGYLLTVNSSKTGNLERNLIL
jgi:hypothetical protein